MRVLSRCAMLVTLLLALGAEKSASAGDMLTLASGRTDAPAYAAGVGLASLIKVELLPTHKIDLQAVVSAGAVDNVRLMQEGAAQFAILPSVVGHAARVGIGSFTGDAPELAFRGITALWRDAVHLVVREGDVSSGTIDDLLKLKDRKVFLGDAASGMIDANNLLLADLGLDIDKAFDIATVPDGDGVAAMKRGDVDAVSAAARPPMSMLRDVFQEDSPGIKLLDVTETQMTKANGNHWLWTPYVIPAATYPGQHEDVWTIALSNLLVVRADVDADVVYTITKSIFENLPYLQRVDPLMSELTLDTALAGMAMPLHPGALRYFQEAGLISKVAPPSPMPVDLNEPEDGQEPSYPDSDVAGQWSQGAGGPLTTTSVPSGGMAAEPGGQKTEPVGSGPETAPSRPYWHERATL